MMFQLRFSLLMILLSCVLLVSSCGGSDEDGCSNGETRCAGYNLIQLCNPDGSWGEKILCPGTQTCQDGACVGASSPDGDNTSECAPDETECVGEQLRRCDTDGNWGELENCPTGTTCNVDQCTSNEEPLCQAAVETRCTDDSHMETCDDTGLSWSDPVACDDGQFCIDGSCQLIDCQPGMDTACNAEGDVVTCNAQGNGYGAPVACPANTRCEEGICVEIPCTAGDFRCVSQTEIQYCVQDGGSWDTAQSCASGEICESGTGCVPSGNQVCEPGSTVCLDERTIATCNSEGSGYMDETDACEAGDVGYSCINGQCLDLCDKAELTQSYMGCDYWPVVTPNPALDRAFKSGTESEYAVVISNTNDTYTAQVTISLPGREDIVTSVAPMDDKTVRLQYLELQGSAKMNFAYHLHASIPVTVAQFNPLSEYHDGEHSYTNDASLLLPTSVLGKSYMAMSATPVTVKECDNFWCDEYHFETQGYRAFVSIVGTYEGTTTIQVTASAAIKAGAGVEGISAGETREYTLQQHEVLQLVGDDAFANEEHCWRDEQENNTICMGADLSGTRIQSDQPIAVFSGNECAYVPYTQYACDHLEQQMFPTDIWGQSYLMGEYSQYEWDYPTYYKIMAYEDNTQLQVTPDYILDEVPYGFGGEQIVGCQRTLQAGDYCMIESDSNLMVTALDGKKIAVGQFMVGGSYDDSDPAEYGDPAFSLVPPIQQYRKNYIFLAPDTYAYDYINIMSMSNTATILLDGDPLRARDFEQIDGANAWVMQKKINDGTHLLTSDVPIGLIVYGYDRYVSYAYPAGLDLVFVPY